MNSNPKNQNFSIVAVTVSDIFTKEMSFNANCIERLGGLYIWVKLESNPNRKSDYKIKEESGNFLIFDYPKNYSNSLTDPKIYWAVKKFEDYFKKHSWFFWIDDDEILSRKDWRIIILFTKFLPKISLYAFPRIWVLVKPTPMRVRSARSARRIFDWQFRLFYSEGLEVPNEIIVHEPINRTIRRRLFLGIRIIHFGYKKGAIEIKKSIAHYEEATPGSGISKERYYFPKTSVDYKFIKLNNIVEIKGLTRKTIKQFFAGESV
jgi:hypothetical protein